MNFKTTFVTAALTALIGFSASAKELNGNVIVRVNPETGATEQMITSKKITSAEEAQELAKTGNFKSIEGRVAVNELDREQGASSWYFYCPYCYNQGGWNGGYQPSYYYYGASYSSYYSFSWQNYSYYYYGSSSYRSYYGSPWYY